MNEFENAGVNVASKRSTNGHFLKKAKVICLDGITETSVFEAEGEVVLTTANHTDLKREGSGLITIQEVVDPISRRWQNAAD